MSVVDRMSAAALVKPGTKDKYWVKPVGAKASPVGWGRLAWFVFRLLMSFRCIYAGSSVDDLHCIAPRFKGGWVFQMVKEVIRHQKNRVRLRR